MTDVHTFNRSPATVLTGSILKVSIQARPIVYSSTYRAKTRPWPIVNRRSAQMTTTATPTSHSDSYKNVGWKVSKAS